MEGGGVVLGPDAEGTSPGRAVAGKLFPPGSVLSDRRFNASLRHVCSWARRQHDLPRAVVAPFLGHLALIGFVL